MSTNYLNSFYESISRIFFGWSIKTKRKIDPSLNPADMTPGEMKELLIMLFPSPKNLYQEKNQRLCRTMLEHALPLIFDAKIEGPLTFSVIQDHFRPSKLIELSFTEAKAGLRPEILKLWFRQLPGADVDRLNRRDLPPVFYQAFEAATRDLNQALSTIVDIQSRV